MTRLVWDPRPLFDNGVDRGILYPAEGPGLPWNGLTNARISVVGSEITSYFLDGIKVSRSTHDGSAQGALTAFTYPDPLEEPTQEVFGLSYRTFKGDNSDLGYRLHIFYDAILTPSERSYSTKVNGVNASSFEFSINTLPTEVDTYSPSAHFIIDSSSTYPWMIKAIEEILYGKDDAPPRLPSIEELLELFEHYSILIITDLGDGSFTAEGPDNVVRMVDDDSFTIDWFSVETFPDYVYSVHTA